MIEEEQPNLQEMSETLFPGTASSGLAQWKIRLAVVVAGAMIIGAVAGLPLVFGSDSDDDVVALLETPELTTTTLDEVAGFPRAQIAQVAGPSTLATVPEDESTSSTERKFSANRSTCLRLYSEPTLDVAFRFQGEPRPIPSSSTSTTVAEETTTTTAASSTSSVDETTVSSASSTSSSTIASSISSTSVESTTTSVAPTTTERLIAPPALPGWADAGNGVNVPIVLLAIRCCESRNNYLATNSKSTASGAYQFLDGTWAGQFGVRRALWATPAQQDMAAVAEWRKNGTRPWNASKHCWGQDA